MLKKRNLLAILLIGAMTVGCQPTAHKSETSDTLFSSFFFEATNDGFPCEKTWWVKSYFQSEASILKASVTIEDEVLSGTYVKSTLGSFGWKESHIYQTDDGDEFIIDGMSGELIGFCKNSSKWEEKEKLLPNLNNPSEETLEIAKSYIGGYVDVEKYTIENVGMSTVNEGQENEQTLYTYNFVKVIDGYNTNDSIYIQVTYKGGIQSCKLNNIGDFDNAPISSIDKQQVDKSVEKKLERHMKKSMYQSYNYSIITQTVTYSPEKDFVVVSKVKLHLIPTKGLDMEREKSLVTVIGKVTW